MIDAPNSGVYTRTGASVSAEAGAPSVSAYGQALRAAGARLMPSNTVVPSREYMRQQVGTVATRAPVPSTVSGTEAYNGVLPNSRLPRINKPRPWLVGAFSTDA